MSQVGIPDEVDVAIVGSGGAGLMAALSAVYGGAGGTISLGLVFGYLAGREAARQQDEA